jgi:hypothetical protein
VTVKIELVRGSDVIASVSGDNIEVEEEERISKALSVPVKREVFGSPATLRVTVAVRLDVPAAGLMAGSQSPRRLTH